MTTMNTPAPQEGPQGSLTPQPSPIAIHLAQALIEKYPQITYGISVPSSVPEDRKSTNAYQAVIIGGFLQGKCAGLAVNNYATLESQLAQSDERVKALSEGLAKARTQLTNVQPHIAQLPKQDRPFIDSHVDEAIYAIDAAILSSSKTN